MPKLVSLKMVQISIAITIFALAQSKFRPFLIGPVLAFTNKLAFEKVITFLESRKDLLL